MHADHYNNFSHESEETLKFVLSKACPVISQLEVGSDFCQFKKKIIETI